MVDLTHCIRDWLDTYYLIQVVAITKLPVGADVHASIYKVQSIDQKSYFVKVKRGYFHHVTIDVLELLQRAGVQQLIAPITTSTGTQIQQVNDYTLIVYPFIEGKDGFISSLTDVQWIALGRALKQIHAIAVPVSVQTKLRQEHFSPKWRNVVRSLYNESKKVCIHDEIAANLWQFLQENSVTVQKLIHRAEELGQKACTRHLDYVLCHSDIHAGNVLIDATDDVYIVDWDDPILAPKERDLMFIGGGVGNVWNQPYEERLFYEGYGEVDIDWPLVAYYRFERIVEDIAVYSQELLLNPVKDNNRLEMYMQFMDMFAQNGVVDIAFATDMQVTDMQV